MTDPRDEPTRIEPAGGDATRAFEPEVPGGPGEPPPPTWSEEPGPPPPGRPDGRVWIIVALVVVILALLAWLLLGGDDDDDDATTGDTSTSLATSTSTSTTEGADTTAAPTTVATTVAPPVTLDPDDCEAAGANPAQPGLAAQTVFEAWTLGDEACADVLMTGAALAELFSRDGAGATDDFKGCTEVDQPDPHADCAFTYEGGSTHYLMQYSPTDGWQVFDIEQIAD